MTIYKFLKENNIPFSHADLSRIGIAACKTAKENNINYPKIKQKEGKRTFWVSDFPDSFIHTIDLVTKNYFEEQAAKALILPKPIPVKSTVSKKEKVQKPDALMGSRQGTGKGFLETIKATGNTKVVHPTEEFSKSDVPGKKQRKRIPIKPELKKK